MADHDKETLTQPGSVSPERFARIRAIFEAALERPVGERAPYMEYVDGEDLRGLLRRIGRLPGDKALEIARKLCAGLAAAHEKGILHRDLKPANIMIDGQGQVRIMDFGLAAVADAIPGSDIRSGTPAYMAPEQLAGKEVSERSDIYALGLIFHEIFTGKPAFQNGDRSTVPSAVRVIGDIDPAVDRVIVRCLDPDPAKRPQSALDVARMLPGGDPLAEALAAGDTPSPQLVANSGSHDGLRVPVAVACLVFIAVGIIGLAWLGSTKNPYLKAPLEMPPEVLAAEARRIASNLGYTNRPVDRAYGWFNDSGVRPYLLEHLEAVQFTQLQGNNRPALQYFWYRESPHPLASLQNGDPVTLTNPPPAEPGNLEILLDSEGRLMQFRAWPESTQGPEVPSEPVLQMLLDAARLDRSDLTSTEPTLIPTLAFDAREAWTTTEGGHEVDVEVASWRGRVVSFQRLLPWDPSEPPNNAALGGLMNLFLPVVAAFVAWRNLRLGRGDRRGANRLSGFLFVCTLTQDLLLAHHVAGGAEIGVLATALVNSVYTPVSIWLIYIAFEPYLRRYAPKTLIGWTRLLEGRWHDPLVGGASVGWNCIRHCGEPGKWPGGRFAWWK